MLCPQRNYTGTFVSSFAMWLLPLPGIILYWHCPSQDSKWEKSAEMRT